MLIITQLIAKIIYKLIVTFNLGAGYTWPGYLALKIYPKLIQRFFVNLNIKIILVSGTNGKTTTSKVIAHLLSKKNPYILHNLSGANMLNGIASAVLIESPLFSKNKLSYAVFEVDEFTLPVLLQSITPFCIVLLNLSRDQLDRYGEVDIILDRWKAALKEVKGNCRLVLDATQKYLQPLADTFEGSVYYFDDNKDSLLHTKLVGDFNAKNVNAGMLVSRLCGIANEDAVSYLSTLDYAWGRGELIEYSGKKFNIFLAKNPMSFNNNLDMLTKEAVEADTLFFILNDEVRDGRDVSWIYDIDAQKLNAVCKNKRIFVGGTRCWDFAARLYYADILLYETNVSTNLKELLLKIVSNKTILNVTVFPNYSSMLDIREILTGKKIL